MLPENNMDDPVKLIVTFPSHVKLGPLVQQLQSEYSYIQQIKIHSAHQLLISFDSMADLLEIDFINDFSAVHTQVKNSHSFNLEMLQQTVGVESTSDHQHFSDSINQMFEPSLDKREVQNFEMNPKGFNYRPRLTSFEQQVVMEQNMRKEFGLFDDTMESGAKIKFQNQDIGDQTQRLEQQSKPNRQDLDGNLWDVVMGGLVLTSLLVGGVRAIRFLFS